MNTLLKWSGAVALVILAIMGGLWLLGHNQQPKLGSTACNVITCLSGGLRLVTDAGGDFESDVAAVLTGGTKIGTSGTNLNAIVVGNCTLWTAATTIAATSTVQAVCQSATNGSIAALTGVTTDSICNVKAASSTNTTIGGLVVEGVSASSTAGTIVAQIANLTGTTFTWASTASSSNNWTYSCYDPV